MRYGLLWTAFIASTLMGAALVSSRDPRMNAVGLGLLLVPLVALSGVLLRHYLAVRAAGKEDQRK